MIIGGQLGFRQRFFKMGCVSEKIVLGYAVRWADEWMSRQADVYMTDQWVMEGPLPQQTWSEMTLDTHT